MICLYCSNYCYILLIISFTYILQIFKIDLSSFHFWNCLLSILGISRWVFAVSQPTVQIMVILNILKSGLAGVSHFRFQQSRGQILTTFSRLFTHCISILEVNEKLENTYTLNNYSIQKMEIIIEHQDRMLDESNYIFEVNIFVLIN